MQDRDLLNLVKHKLDELADVVKQLPRCTADASVFKDEMLIFLVKCVQLHANALHSLPQNEPTLFTAAKAVA